jgi:hypothetical protein
VPGGPPVSAVSSGIASRPGFVYLKAATANLCGVQSADGRHAFFLFCHLDEPETSGSPRHLVRDDFGGQYCPVGFKKFSKLVLTGVKGQVPHINVDTHLPNPFGAHCLFWDNAATDSHDLVIGEFVANYDAVEILDSGAVVCS